MPALHCNGEAATGTGVEDVVAATKNGALVQQEFRGIQKGFDALRVQRSDQRANSDGLYFPFADAGTKASLFQLADPSSLRLSCRKATPSSGTMKPGTKLHAVLEETDRVQASSIPGDIVEAGVAGGGGILPVIFYLACTGDLAQRTVHLFDTWEGLAPTSSDPGFVDGQYKVDYDAFLANVEQYRTAYGQQVAALNGSLSWDEAWKRVNIVKGLFANTMPGALAGRSLSILMCDGDMYSSTKDCLGAAVGLVVSGGTIYNDDYYTFSGCYQAMHEYNRLPDNSTKYKVLLVPDIPGGAADFSYMTEDGLSCTPPQDNSGATRGTCNSVAAEAALIHVM